MAQESDQPNFGLNYELISMEHLRETAGGTVDNEADQETEESQASYGGRAAWMLLLAAFVIEAQLWGL